MADSEDALLIGITGRESLNATELASLLKLLSADYRKLTKGELGLYRYETGSSWLYLLEVLKQIGEAAVVAERMAKFATAVKDFFHKDKPQRVASSPPRAVTKSMEKLVSIAAEKGAGLKVSYKKGKESIDIELTPQDVYRRHEDILVAKEPTPRALTARERPAQISADRFQATDEWLSKLSEASDANPDIEELVSIIVALTSADPHQLSQIASMLDERGKGEIAAAIRRRIPPRAIVRPMIPRD